MSGLPSAAGPPAAGVAPRGVAPRGAARPGPVRGARRPAYGPGIVEHDELYEDYDSLYGGYGDARYVEPGYRPRPNYGVGPRLRNYYSDDWFDDGADFDDWYDSMEEVGEDLTQPVGLEDEGSLEGDLGGAADIEAVGGVPEPN